MELCQTVMVALQKSNGKVYNDLLSLAVDSEKLKELVKKPELQDFLYSLSGLNLISR